MPHEGQRGQCNYRALVLGWGPWCALNCFTGGGDLSPPGPYETLLNPCGVGNNDGCMPTTETVRIASRG